MARYQGTWYEIAKLPNRFQDQCVAGTRAEYTLLDDGRVEVINRCRLASGATEEVRGRARRPDPDRPAALEVRFAPAWLSWLPMVWGDYQVMALDRGYRWALVGEPSRKFLWILSRTRGLPRARIDELLAEARRQGFPVDRIDFTPQDDE
nr:lipocalin family protein [Wenzhouxiangella sp. XN79A]